MNSISNPLMNLQSAATCRQTAGSKSLIGNSNTMTTSQQQQIYQQALAMNDLARRHYAQTISRATNLSHLQLLNRYQQQQQQQQLCCIPNLPFALKAPLSPIQQQQLQQQQKYATFNQRDPVDLNLNMNLMGLLERQAALNKPLCRCRVMYLGSSVPHITKNGLHGIQEPLRHLYPEEQFSRSAGRTQHLQQGATIDISHLSAELGIDSWLSVWSNGLLLENVDEFGRDIKRFFSIESLHYCAAVRFFDASSLINDNQLQQQQPAKTTATSAKTSTGGAEQGELGERDLEASDQNNNSQVSTAETPAECKLTAEHPVIEPGQKSVVRFLPLDAPLFRCPGMLDTKHPPMFSAIMRRTSGIKVLECHAFICRRDAAANALVRCCTHAYADLLSARRVSSASSASQQVDHFGAAPPSKWSPSLSAAAAAAAANSHQLYQANHTNHLSLARRGRQHLAGGQRKEAFAQPVEGFAGTGSGRCPAGGEQRAKAKRNGRNSASSDDTPSSLCDGRDGTNSSGDDNYAIISRHQSHRRANSREPADASAQMTPTQAAILEKQSDTSIERGTIRRMKPVGSSKSLYADFMPNEGRAGKNRQPKAAAATAGSNNLRLMSHSMDLLEVEEKKDRDRNEPKDCCGPTKRHSKSMQNLLDFRADRHSFSSHLSGGSSSGRPWAAGASGSGSGSRRRQRHLARDQRSKRSLQDLGRGRPESGQGSQLAGWQPSGDPMRGELLGQADKADTSGQAIYDRPTMNYYERIERGTPRANGKKRDRGRSIAATKSRPSEVSHSQWQCLSQSQSQSQSQSRSQTHGYSCPGSGSGSGAGVGSGPSSTNTRRSGALGSGEPSQQPVQLYAAPSLAHQLSAHHHLAHMAMPLPVSMSMPMSMPLPVPLPLPMALGLPMSVSAPMSAYPMDAYYGGTLLKYPAGYCLPAPAPAPAPPQPHTQPQPQPQPPQSRHELQMPAIAYGQRPAADSHYANSAGASASLSHRKRKRHVQGAAKSPSLATRFRCLSPPLSFMSGSRSAAAKGRPASEPRRAETNEQLEAQAATKSQEDQSVAGQLDNVVSAEPGFISHSSSSKGNNNSNNNNSNNNNDNDITITSSSSNGNADRRTIPAANGKRLSWIKRLSRTISGGSRSPGPAQAANSSEEPRADVQKRPGSRLFVASLSLGRTSRSRAKQQQQSARTTLVTSS